VLHLGEKARPEDVEVLGRRGPTTRSETAGERSGEHVAQVDGLIGLDRVPDAARLDEQRDARELVVPHRLRLDLGRLAADVVPGHLSNRLRWRAPLPQPFDDLDHERRDRLVARGLREHDERGPERPWAPGGFLGPDPLFDPPKDLEVPASGVGRQGNSRRRIGRP
jgi:hypothetical protein